MSLCFSSCLYFKVGFLYMETFCSLQQSHAKNQQNQVFATCRHSFSNAQQFVQPTNTMDNLTCLDIEGI